MAEDKVRVIGFTLREVWRPFIRCWDVLQSSTAWVKTCRGNRAENNQRGWSSTQRAPLSSFFKWFLISPLPPSLTHTFFSTHPVVTRTPLYLHKECITLVWHHHTFPLTSVSCKSNPDAGEEETTDFIMWSCSMLLKMIVCVCLCSRS